MNENKDYPKIGDRFMSRNGQIGTIEEISGVKMLVVRNKYKITQTIVLRKIDIKQFKKIENETHR